MPNTLNRMDYTI